MDRLKELENKKEGKEKNLNTAKDIGDFVKSINDREKMLQSDLKIGLEKRKNNCALNMFTREGKHIKSVNLGNTFPIITIEKNIAEQVKQRRNLNEVKVEDITLDIEGTQKSIKEISTIGKKDNEDKQKEVETTEKTLTPQEILEANKKNISDRKQLEEELIKTLDGLYKIIEENNIDIKFYRNKDKEVICRTTDNTTEKEINMGQEPLPIKGFITDLEEIKGKSLEKEITLEEIILENMGFEKTTGDILKEYNREFSLKDPIIIKTHTKAIQEELVKENSQLEGIRRIITENDKKTLLTDEKALIATIEKCVIAELKENNVTGADDIYMATNETGEYIFYSPSVEAVNMGNKILQNKYLPN